MDRETLSLSRLKWGHWTILVVALVMSVVGLWQSVLPYLAERHYRDGFNFDAATRYKYAVEELEIAVQYAPWETQYIMALAKAIEGLADQTPDVPTKIQLLQRAESLYLRTIDLDVMNPWQHNRLGAVYTLMADLIPARRVELTAMAEREVRSAAEYDHQNPLFQLNLAYYLHRAGRFEEARKYYQIVLDMDPNILEAHYNMADISRREGKIGDTLKSYLAVYTVNKDFPNINLALAGTYAQMGRTADAIPYMEAEIKKRPDFVDGIKSLITMYQQTGNFARIAELYYQLIMLNPGSKDYYPAFAAAVKTAGKSDATLASLNQLKAQNPNAQVLDELIALVR